MKRILAILSSALICVAMCGLQASAQHRGGARPGAHGSRPAATHSPAPSHSHGNKNHGTRPNPAHRPDHGTRPNPVHRPDHGTVHRPTPPNHGHIAPRPPHHAPAGWHHHHCMTPPPPRHWRPVYRPWSRPLPPPPAWRYAGGGPVFNTILGVAFGATVYATIDALVNSGYSVDGYNNGVVYVRDVNQMGYIWPDATMYYGPGGGFRGSEFYYTTAYNDPTRYNAMYSMLMSRYGLPTVRNGNSSVWYGPGGVYVSLSYGLGNTCYGTPGYITTLTFGN